MKTVMIAWVLILLLSYPIYAQTTEYDYSCGDKKAKITWSKSSKNNLIYLKTVQGSEVQTYMMTPDYHTISWEYSNQAKFFGCDYYINLPSGQFIQYKGVQGAPGTPETRITIRK